MTTVAGVILVTAPGAGPRVAARLARRPGIELAGGDGDSLLAVVWEAHDGATLVALARQLVAEDPDLVGAYPTFVGEDEGA